MVTCPCALPLQGAFLLHAKYFSFQKINGLLFVIDNWDYVAEGCIQS